MRRQEQRLVGSGPVLQTLRREIEHAAKCDAKVLITGESGSGKEIVARMIHAESRRRRAAMRAVNCAAMAESLLETELFGHVRGSFTGAYRDRAGIFEATNGGTVLLDEIGETSPRMQGMLLRFLETGEVQPVGSDRPHATVDVRIIAATHRVLADCVAAGTFRDDLYFRLNIIEVRVPPLREHPEDVPDLFEYWFEQLAQSYGIERPVLSDEALAALQSYSWPGNVRELRNVAERMVSRGGGRMTLTDLPPEILGHRARVAEPRDVPAVRSRADTLFDLVVSGGQSFWGAVYEPFILRDLTRDDLRAIVSRGLAQTCGSYRLLVELFNMPAGDYKRFLSFLHKHHCHMPFQQFRSATPLKITTEQVKTPQPKLPKTIPA